MTIPSPETATNTVAIGASAGGVEALMDFFKALPPAVDAAFLVVLHLPPHGESRLAEILGRVTAMEVAPAGDGDPILPNRVYVARTDRHLMVEGARMRLTRGPRECRARPAVDVLFRSVALHCGPRAIGVVLSGALDDGSAGLWAIKDRQGIALVQEPSDARFGSMPESALRHVDVDMVGTAAALAAEIVRRTQRPQSPQAPVAGAPERLVVESLIAGEGNALQNGVMGLGEVSKYTCPECHGVLVQIAESSIVRFRCHTGHGFSIQTLLAEVNESIDATLWAAVRALEERLLLLRQSSGIAQRHGRTQEVESCERQARHVEARIGTVRELVLDHRLFGNDPG